MTRSSLELKRPVPAGWVSAPTERAGRAETWIHPGTGLVAVSSVHAGDRECTGSGYCLTIYLPGGQRCSAALAFLALADFGLLGAIEDVGTSGSERIFRLAVT